MVSQATVYSAAGAEFLHGAKPSYPLETYRNERHLSTVVRWSDGVEETIDDLDILQPWRFVPAINPGDPLGHGR